jgi:type 2 lantibiotic biosynthesis protein LanM
MNDGVVWSAQADFAARLADWEHDSDPVWPLQRAERAAVAELNVPHFVTASDGHEIRDATGTSTCTGGTPGLDRARARLHGLTEVEIEWQAELIRQTTTLTREPGVRDRPLRAVATSAPGHPVYIAEAEALARMLSTYAIRKGPSAAWLGLDWLGDSEVSQLVVLGADLYNGSCGLALFLAAHGAVANDTSSKDLAVAALARLRQTLRGHNPARAGRVLGVGGGLGLGSIVYGLTVISAFLGDDDLLVDAHTAAALITGEVISADRQLDVLGGSAGAILGLLRLYRQAGSEDVLRSAISCGRHLLAQDRVGRVGRRTWVAPAFGRPLNGMSHGAAGFAYALAVLASATGNEEFACAASECLAFEDSTFDAASCNWADLRGGSSGNWPCKWCYGAPGIGLARAAMARQAAADGEHCRTDIRNALVGVERGWPGSTDTLCCGTLGSVEFLWEAGEVLERSELRDLASRRLLAVVETARSNGDYRWSAGTSRFNLGLFRGIAGVGYTALRRVDDSLPNVLIWE